METPHSSGVEYEKVGKGYFEHRQLQRGVAGWMLLVGLGLDEFSMNPVSIPFVKRMFTRYL